MNPIRGPYPASGLRVRGKSQTLERAVPQNAAFSGFVFPAAEVDAGDEPTTRDDISVFSCRGVVGEIRAEA